MATYTQLINSVLRKLRESQISSPTDTTYSTLIGDFVNDTKREVEDAHPWSVLRTTIDVTTAAGTSQYALTGAGDRWRFYKGQSVFNDTQDYCLVKRPARQLKRLARLNAEQNYPLYYYFEGQDSSGDPYVTFYSIPDGVYTISFDIVLPQADLSTGSTVLKVPAAPVILGAWAKAIDERGEDGGTSVSDAMSQYQNALADAISIDYTRLDDDEEVWDV